MGKAATNPNRNLDITVARLRGLDVLGEAPCWQDECGTWLTSFDNFGKLQMVYLRFCACDCAEPGDTLHFDHIAGCLEVVPFYSKDHSLAIEALEQICDEHGLMPEMYRDNEWHVKLSAAIGIAHGHNKSLAVAICRALGELEK